MRPAGGIEKIAGSGTSIMGWGGGKGTNTIASLGLYDF